jgi:pimeloyl-ACP methyl ester carboxylesterase
MRAGSREASAMEKHNYVLVHGAWHGGWCYRRVADLLRAQGHRVYTPTLTGLGERSHLLDERVNLTTHIMDVVNLVRWEELDSIVLCGHSYGGLVITGVADRIADRIATLVYLDAFVPENGQAMRDLTHRQLPDAPTMPPVSAAAFEVNEKDRAWVDRQCTPHPLAAMNEKIALTGAWRGVKRKLYIRAISYASPPFDATYRRLETDPAWSMHGLPCGHDVMVDMPKELAALLLAA